MRITERSYSSKLIRPRPVIHAESDGSLLVITTSWGPSDHAARVNDEILKYVQAALADVEVTSPFEFQTCLSDEANYLRVAIMISNERFYRSDNKVEYTAGLEVLALLKKGDHIAYAQVGGPNLLVHRGGLGIAPISVQYEVAMELAAGSETDQGWNTGLVPGGRNGTRGGDLANVLSPLPQSLLGVDSSVNIRSGDFRHHPADQLIAYAGTFWPGLLAAGTEPTIDLASITTKLAQKNPEAPFWLGLITTGE